ncbi:endoribonuclease [Aureococcus anophagefferens]|nr:endoribonuclease [Aureococcus anophagefferens]
MRLGILLSAALVAVADKRVVNVDGWEKSPLFSHAVVSGDTVYVSGMIGVDMSTMKLCPGGVYNQTLCAFANIETMLHAAGTSLDKVLDCVLRRRPRDRLRQDERGLRPSSRWTRQRGLRRRGRRPGR